MKSDIPRLQGYLRRALGSPALTVKADPKDEGCADVLCGTRRVGRLVVDDEDEDRTYHFEVAINEKPQPLSVQELVRIQTVLREMLGAKTLAVRARGRLKDSAEVFVGDESLAIVSADTASYQFQMAILDIDLEDV